MFTSEQLVVYPAQGVGQIERIDSQNIGGSACDFYIVRIRANSITLMVPVKNASNVGLRTLVSTKEAEHIWNALRNNPQQTVHTGQNWNRRFREYSERLKRICPSSPMYCANSSSSAGPRISPLVSGAFWNRP